MKLTNTTRDKNFILRAGKECFMLKAGRTEEVPEKYLKDSVYLFALGSGKIVKAETEEVKTEEAQTEEPEVIEEPKKTRKKKSDD